MISTLSVDTYMISFTVTPKDGNYLASSGSLMFTTTNSGGGPPGPA